MFNTFSQFVEHGSTWAYLVVLLFSVFDVFIPIIPSETVVITAGVIAATGGLSIAAILACAACGAFVGDNSAYLLASRVGDRATRRIARNESGQRHIEWARRQLQVRSGELIVAGRFIPGGRTAVAFAAGATRFPWRRFASFDAIAAISWAGYAALLGYFGGRVFEDSPWRALLAALGIAFGVTLSVEIGRKLVGRYRHGQG